MTEEGQIAWGIALQPGVWRMGNATISGSMAGSLTLLIATGLDMAAGHARLPAGIGPERVEIITRLLEAIETGRAEAESQRMAHLRESAASRSEKG